MPDCNGLNRRSRKKLQRLQRVVARRGWALVTLTRREWRAYTEITGINIPVEFRHITRQVTVE